MASTTTQEVYVEMYKLAKLHKKKLTNNNEIERHLRSAFGFDAVTIALTWNMLVKFIVMPNCARIKYLLYMCSFLKTNCTYSYYSQFFEVSYRTFYTWVWYFAENVAKLPVVSIFTDIIFFYIYLYVFLS
jgi:hypothetical protein